MRPRLLLGTAIVLLAVPPVALSLIALAELIGGDPTGVQHIPEAMILVVMIVLAARHPRGAGVVVVTGAIAIFTLWFGWGLTTGFRANPNPAWAWIAAGAALFVPPLVAGILLLQVAAAARRPGTRD